jgi:hypothetical protein
MDSTVEFTVDPRDVRRNLIITALVGLVVLAGGGLYLQYRLKTPWVWLGMAALALVATVRVAQEARPGGIVLHVAPDAMTLRFGQRETRMPWSEVRAMALSSGGLLMIKPGPGLTVPGRWEQRWWARGAFGRRFLQPTYELFVRPGYPQWSRGVRDWVVVLRVGWFPKDDRERLVELVTRYAGSTA